MTKSLSFITTTLIGIFAWTTLCFAQESVTLSISPTLYDMSAEPGQAWSSSLKVVNVNPFDLTVYAEVVNFSPQGEGGDGRFLPIDPAQAEGATLAEWFTISREPITIPREQTIEIPFTVQVPTDASPGGHFAAILVGTKPVRSEEGLAKLQTAQMVTSLFFTRIAGDITEAGSIREFTTTKSLLSRPEATFSLRFENKGNVHLQPQGEIKIFNMWGEERGVIPINQYTSFGNVLPNSIRKFLFTWEGEWSVSDVGRYTAIATLGYGSSEKKFSTSTTIFWVLPVKLLLTVLVGLVLFVSLLTWLIRLYVRHMLQLAGVGIEEYSSVHKRAQGTRQKPMLHAPVQAGILDLTSRIQSSHTVMSRVREVCTFISRYRLFFFGVSLIVIFIIIVVVYVRSANTAQRAYEVTYMQAEGVPTASVSSEQILYNQLKGGVGEAVTEERARATVSVVNRSGSVGAGAALRIQLEAEGYKVESLEADLSTTQERTVIVAPGDKYNEALEISRLLNNALVSLTAAEEGVITIFVGSNAESQ